MRVSVAEARMFYFLLFTVRRIRSQFMQPKAGMETIRERLQAVNGDEMVLCLLSAMIEEETDDLHPGTLTIGLLM